MGEYNELYHPKKNNSKELYMYKERIKYYLTDRRSEYISIPKRLLFIFCGAFMAALALQLFLMKNNVIDGGIVGVSIILSHMTSIEVGFFLLVLNTPFFCLGYSYLGKRFILFSLFAILILSFCTHLLEPYPSLTQDPLIVIFLGGGLLGLGVGMVIRFGGSLDGTEVLGILFSQRTSFSIGQIVMFLNFFIFLSSIFIFGLKEALFSLATFFVVYQTIDYSIKQ
ncbi:YitT family protein [Neobacillus niacini]|uniref:YitT family protein n=1 Tax=Neobacillus niacini TaxID=86668 RepID=UPI002DBE62DF|nr:YitT family protein [Neobacillus niacini]